MYCEWCLAHMIPYFLFKELRGENEAKNREGDTHLKHLSLNASVHVEFW